MHQTHEDIRTRGLAALRKQLGRAGMIRFLQQFETGLGDYAKQRRQWVERTTLADLKQKAIRPRRSRRKKSKGS